MSKKRKSHEERKPKDSGIINLEDFSHLRPSNHQDSHSQSPVRVVAVAAPIFPDQFFVETFHPILRCQLFRLIQVVHQLITLMVHIRRDVVSDLAGRVAQAHSGIKCRSPYPQWSSLLVHLLVSPKTNVMEATRIIAHGLLECQVLFATEEEEVAHGGVVIGAS